MSEPPLTFITDWSRCLTCDRYEDCKPVFDAVDSAARRGSQCASREGKHPAVRFRPVCEERGEG